MFRLLFALAALLLLGGPAQASEQDGSALSRANERATEATRGTARDVGKALERGNERATEVTRGTAKKVGEAAEKAAEDLGETLRGLGKKRPD